jgi:hypothetical protein
VQTRKVQVGTVVQERGEGGKTNGAAQVAQKIEQTTLILALCKN